MKTDKTLASKQIKTFTETQRQIKAGSSRCPRSAGSQIRRLMVFATLLGIYSGVAMAFAIFGFMCEWNIHLWYPIGSSGILCSIIAVGIADEGIKISFENDQHRRSSAESGNDL